MSKKYGMLLGVDAFVTLILVCGMVAVVPINVPTPFSKEFYGLAASVLSIVFSVFTASLAIIISSPDDKFVMFLEEEALYEHILFGFKFTLWTLFVALIYSIAAFIVSSYAQVTDVHLQSRWYFIGGAGLLCYSLTATLSSTVAAIQYARKRAEFLRLNPE